MSKQIHKPTRKMSRRDRMREGGALCHCGSEAVLFAGLNFLGRPTFRCDECDSWWMSGNDGKPYSNFVQVESWYRKGESPKEIEQENARHEAKHGRVPAVQYWKFMKPRNKKKHRKTSRGK